MNNLVGPVPAALCGLALFFIPGLLFLSLLPRPERDALELDERLFLMVAVSTAGSAWLALLLAEAGRFGVITAGVIVAVVGFVLAVVLRRHLGWPLRRPDRWSSLVPLTLLLGLALVLQARPTEHVMGGRDPGTYVAAMSLIGRTGGILYRDPAVLSIPAEYVDLFYRHPDKPGDFEWGRFMGFPLERPETGRVVPEFFHLFPAFGAYFFQAMGVKGALATPPFFGVLATLAVFFALRSWLGSAPALLATLLLELNVLQVWFARYPVSEMVSQFLLFLGLAALLRWEERGAGAWGALCGFAFGLSLLVRIDSLLVALPLAVYILIRRAQGRVPGRRLLALALPFGLLTVHACVHALFWSRKYALNILSRPYWRQPVWVWTLVLPLSAALIVAAQRVGPRVLDACDRRAPRLRRGLVIALVCVALYAYFLRPWLSAWAGGDGNEAGAALAQAGLLRRLGFARLAAHDAQAFLRFGWFVTPIGLLLALAGLGLRVREWRSRELMPTLLTLSFALFYFYKMRIWNDYFFAMRRVVPFILPVTLGFAAWALWRLITARGPRRLLGAVLSAFLAISFLAQTWPLGRFVDWKGSVNFVAELSRRFTKDDVVIFEQPRSIHLLALPLWAVHGLNVLELARFNPDPSRLNGLIRAWNGRYQNIYFVHTYSTDLCGVFLERVQAYEFPSLEFERTYDRPPKRPEARAMRFTVSRVVLPENLNVPAVEQVDIGGSDDFQVSGFFEKEGGGEHSYRWSGHCGSVYLPGARAGARITITAGVGRRPATKPATVSASLSGVALGNFTVTADWTNYALTLPSPLPPGPPVLRIDVPDWSPVKELPGSDDPRNLGIMLDRIRIGAAP